MTDNPLDPTVFADSSISDETRQINATIVEKLADYDQWSITPAEVRRLRKEGFGPFPLAPRSDRAVWHDIDGPAGPLRLRIIAPSEPRGAYLHIHGGGWVFGAPDEQDPRLDRLADNCGLAVVSVDYRLAPEEPYPAAPDDCEAAALWLLENAGDRFGTERLLIGGESAGAHLSAVTLLRLRDRHGLSPFSGVNFTAGCFDLSLTPSVRCWGSEKLILNTRDIENFVASFLTATGSVDDPDVSPIQGDLKDLPPALFTVGTRDPLLDDSLFMAGRWAAAGNRSELAVYPGGAHVFTALGGEMADQALGRIDTFMNSV